MRVLVTGGAGFIGSQYVRAMLAGEYAGFEDAEVTVLDALTYAAGLDNLPEQARLRFEKGDIRDAETLDAVVPGHEYVVHFAAESHVDRSVAGAAAFVSTNVLGTQQLLDACLRHGVRTVVAVSTDEVYGSIATGSWTETEPLLPNSPYAASKAAADLISRSYRVTHGLDVRITRCCNNFGPRQYVEKLIPLFTTNLLRGRPVPLYGDGGNVREWLHVADHCTAVQLVLTAGEPGGIYNVGSGVHRTNRQLTDRLVELCDADPGLVRQVADRKGHDFRYSVDTGRLAALGFRPAVSLDDGLAATVRWYREHPSWWRSRLSD